MKHEPRRFVKQVDYITSPGWINGPNGRAERGLNQRGPRAVITELGIMRFGEDKRMYLAEYFPGVSLDEIRARTGFEMDLSRAVEAKPPEKEVLEILLTKVDPARIMV